MHYIIGVILLVLIGGGVWLLGTSKEEKSWSSDRVRENIVRKEPKPTHSNVQTVNINLAESVKTSPKNKADAENGKTEKSRAEELRDSVDPKNPDPTRSWRNSEKVKAPVRYMNAVLAYLGKKQQEVQTIRFDIGVTCQEWETKFVQAEKATKADLAVLQEAVWVYRKTDAEKAWPVSFAYRTYSKADFKLKLNALEKRYLNSRAEQTRIQNGLAQLRDSLRKQDQAMETLSAQLKTYSDHLELVRSGKLTGNVDDFLKSLDRSVAAQTQLLRESQQRAEKEIFAPAVQERAEATQNTPDILKRYATEDPEE